MCKNPVHLSYICICIGILNYSNMFEYKNEKTCVSIYATIKEKITIWR